MRESDSNLSIQVEKLHRVAIIARWLFVLFSWLTIGILGIWKLRPEITLLRQHFTWTALRYGIAYNRLASFYLAFCIGATAAVLIRQSLNIIRGAVSTEEKKRLSKQVMKIRSIGPRHPLWRWVIKGTFSE